MSILAVDREQVYVFLSAKTCSNLVLINEKQDFHKVNDRRFRFYAQL